MTANPAAVLQELLDAAAISKVVVGHGPEHYAHERTSVLAGLIRAGLETQQVVCTRCPTEAMSAISLVAKHHLKAETRWQEQHPEDGENAGLHRPGDFRLAYVGETTPDLPPLETPHWSERT